LGLGEMGQNPAWRSYVRIPVLWPRIRDRVADRLWSPLSQPSPA